MVTQADIRRKALAFLITQGIDRGRPYPGQRYRHGWIPVVGSVPKSPKASAEDKVEDVPEQQTERSFNRRAHDDDCSFRSGSYVPPDRNYANGDCQVFAHATQVITGWPVAVFEGAGSHVTTVTDDGRHFDVHGLRDAAAIAAEWQADGPEVVGGIDNLDWLGTSYCGCDLRTVRDCLQAAGLLTDDLAEIAARQIERETD